MRSSALRQIDLTMLGDCRLTIDGNLVSGVPANFFRLAAYLVLSPSRGILPRHRLSSLLWSDADDGKAAANMRQLLVRIRHLQEEHDFQFIEANFSTLHLPRTHDVQCDVEVFVAHLKGERPLTPVELCNLYQGELLFGLDEAGEGYEEWLSNQRDQLHVEAVDRIAAAIAPGSGLSATDRVICARRMLAIDPYNEEALRVLMQEAAEHRQVARLHHLYDSMRTVLAEDLGVQPNSETQALYVQLLRTLTTV